MYILLRNCYLRNLRVNELVRSRRCQHRVCSVAGQRYTCPKFSLQVTCYSNDAGGQWKPLCGSAQPPDLLRRFSLSALRADKEPLKPSSKVEVTVQAIKDVQKNKETLPAETPPRAVQKKSMKERVVDEIKHYYHGFRLLFIDIRISWGLLWRILNGKPLSRREHNLLVRTVGDLFRLVPFSVFIIVPFMEIALPFFIKFFPGMLPSTFQTAKEREDKLQQNLKVKLEMAKFLQKTLDEMAVQHVDRSSASAREFSEWFHRVRTSGATVANSDIMRFAKLFRDEITLDSLSRAQLVALCRVIEVQTLGTNNLLRFQLRMKLRTLAADDKLIQKEGVDSLTVNELQNACKARGMRAYGLSEERLRGQLAQWLDLSLHQRVPPSLLLLSRALMLPDAIPTSDKLKATISVLPDAIVTQTSVAIAEDEGKVDNRMKLEVIREEARKVKEERQERRAERMREEQDAVVDRAPVLDAQATPELMDAAAPATIRPVAQPTKDSQKAEQIRSKDLEVLEDALDSVAKHKLLLEKEVIEDLKEEMADYQEDLQELKQVTGAGGPVAPEVKESKAARRLYNRVNKMIQRMDSAVAELESKEARLKRELAGGESTVTKEDIVRVDELLDAIKRMQKVPDESVLKHIQSILGKIDDDHDGAIKVEDVLKVIEVIAQENVQLSAKQMDDIIELIDKEEILEVEDKIERALQKDAEMKATKKQAAAAAAVAGKDPDKPKDCGKPKADAQGPVVPTMPAPPPPPISIDQVKKESSSSSSKML